MKRRDFVRKATAGSIAIGIGATTNGLWSCRENLNEKDIFPFFKYADKYNIGDYIPKDQGGKFVHEQLINSEDDKIITEAIRGGLIEKEFGNPIDWRKGNRKQINRWLNRLYYVPSFARMYYLTGDNSYLKEMILFLDNWEKGNPRSLEIEETKFTWWDMDVAWRALNLSWFYFLGYDGLTDKDKKGLYLMIEDHSEVLFKEFSIKKITTHNHQSFAATVMLYIAVLFPSLPKSKGLINLSMNIFKFHIENAFYKDGGNVEQMFGYMPFAAFMFRDMYLLCKSANIEIPDGTVTLLQSLANYLHTIAQPNGTTPPVNDSFEMPVSYTIETIEDALDGNLDLKPQASHYFEDTQIGIIRSSNPELEPWYVLVNPASVVGGHANAGRLGFHLWYNNSPIIIDSGCCNYDNPLFKNWYRSTLAHNSVVINDREEEPKSNNKPLWYKKRKTGNRIVSWSDSKDLKFFRMISPGSDDINSSVNWHRDIVLIKDKYLLINDYFNSPEKNNFKVVFHFTPSKIEVDQKRKILTVKNGDNPYKLIPADPKGIKGINIYEGYAFINGENILIPYVTFELEGIGDVHSSIKIVPDTNHDAINPVSKELPNIKMKSK